ncbi:MAG: nucleoside permease [Saprospiraceae bacterium]|nr:nucleoside permease [Saprospiraceae bacterium]
MNLNIRLQLSIMMFLQFFVWGTWYVTMSTYLLEIGFDGVNVGAAYSTVNWGAIVAPVFIGMIADRFFAAEKLMIALHLIGGIILWVVPSITEPGPFFWVMLLYAFCYMPTLALANAICFHQMNEPGKQFPGIRVLGTAGWIAAGLVIGILLPEILGSSIENTALPFKIGAVTSIILGLYSFMLPKTPPKAAETKVTIRDVLGLDALELMKDRSFAIFIISSLLISIPLAFYYSFTNGFLNEMGMENTAAKMTFGQASEVIFMLLIPFFFVRLGVKKMLIIGMLAWAVRYILFAYGNNEELVFMYYIGILLHGVCYDFFFVTGQIYVDEAAPKRIQASAQGFITVVTYGLGMLIGSWSSGIVVDHYTQTVGDSSLRLWTSIWWVPAIMAIGITILFALLFKEKQIDREAAVANA